MSGGAFEPSGKDHKLDAVVLQNRFTDELPADSVAGNQTREVRNAAYSKARPASFSAPSLVAWSEDLADFLNLDVVNISAQKVADIFSGQELLAGSDPYSMAYGGHQFGNWAGQLGDGRAIALGEVEATDGTHRTLQLKGAGPTPYSRRADGLAVLRSSIREFLASEAMHGLGIPTTRALSLVVSGDEVMRDVLYDGRPAPEPGAIVCRTAPSFIRFGNFELFASRGELVELKLLADFTIRHYFSHLDGSNKPTKRTYLQWFGEVCQKTATLMVEWLRVGFVHGVMNTDNMSIHGLTIDYGPFGWLDDFDPSWTPNTTDSAKRRYRYGNQGAVGQWNILQLANAIVPLVGETEPLERSINNYAEAFRAEHQAMMLRKLGLFPNSDRQLNDPQTDQTGSTPKGQPNSDSQLVSDLLNLLTLTETDMTFFFRSLATVDPATVDPTGAVGSSFYDWPGCSDETKKTIESWLRRYQKRICHQPNEDRVGLMNATNPAFVLRNYMAQEAIDQATEGDFSRVDELAKVLQRPYESRPDTIQFEKKRPDWARNRVGCSQLSCSS